MSRYTIAKEFAFSASHVLDGLPEGHQCGRLHGHNYVVEIELTADRVDDRGFVLDYGDLAPFKRLVDDELDHRHLNDRMGTQLNPTAENLAEWLHAAAEDVLGIRAAHRAGADQLGRGEVNDLAARNVRVSAVRVRETPKTVAEYRPPVR